MKRNRKLLVTHVRPRKEIIADLKRALGPLFNLKEFLYSLEQEKPFAQPMGPTRQCLSADRIVNYCDKTLSDSVLLKTRKHLKKCLDCRKNVKRVSRVQKISRITRIH